MTKTINRFSSVRLRPGICENVRRIRLRSLIGTVGKVLFLASCAAMRLHGADLIQDDFGDRNFAGQRDSKKVPLAADWKPWGVAEISLKQPSLFGEADPALQIEKISYRQELLGGIIATLPREITLMRPGDGITLSFDLRGVLYQQHEANRLCVAFLNGSQDYRFGYGQMIRADVRIPKDHPWVDFQAFSSFSGNMGRSLGFDKNPDSKGFLGLCGVAKQSGNIDHIIRVSFTIRRATNGDLTIMGEQTDTMEKVFLKTTRTVAAGELLNGGNSESPRIPYTFTEVFLGVYRGATIQVDNIAVSEIHGS